MNKSKPVKPKKDSHKSSVPNQSKLNISENLILNNSLFHNYPNFCPISSLKDIKDKKVLVMGLGLHGGGEASVRFFLKHGAFVTITDLKTEAELESTIKSLKNDSSLNLDKADFVLGRHDIRDFEEADLVIKNPAVKYEGNIYLKKAKHIESDISLFLRFTKSPIIAITGSKGKSSTASAIHFGLQQAGFHSFLGGNITISPLHFLEKTNENTPVVLELSSWQLSDLRGRGILKPKIAIITKIVPDHLNWYGTMENYIEDKKLINKNQDSSDFTICSADSWGDIFASGTEAQVIRYSSKPFQGHTAKGAWLDIHGKGYMTRNTALSIQMGTEDLKINKKISSNSKISLQTKTATPILDNLLVPGIHMKENMLIASLALVLMGVSPLKTAKIMAKFPGVPHRLEYFHKKTLQNLPTGGTEDLKITKESFKTSFLFYNDSAATVPDATIAALSSFTDPIHLISGGTDKNLDFTELAKHLPKAKSLYLLAGSGTELLIKELDKSSVPYFGPFPSLDALLARLKEQITGEMTFGAQEIILFSPGTASFGMFKNEFDRGNTFKKLILELF
mgnify:FL=1